MPIELTPEGKEAFRAYHNRTYHGGTLICSFEKVCEEMPDAQRMDWNRIAACAVAASRAHTVQAFPSAGLSGPPGMSLWDFYYGLAIHAASRINLPNAEVARDWADMVDRMMVERAKHLGDSSGNS